MILADKIITLRKKAGWSQEELAEQLHVSRQSVSKWEGAQSIPDMEKLLQMSRLFGVTTDFLLKDELEETEVSCVSAEESSLRRVSMEEASAYLALRKAAAPKMALATFLCVISPALLILLAGMSENPAFHLSENLAAAIGLCVLLILVAIGVTLFLSCSARVKEFEFLESEPFETEYGVSGMVRACQKNHRELYTRLNIIGTVLCILSAIPLLAVSIITENALASTACVALLLLLVGFACIAFVYGGTYQSALEKLLEEGEYSRKEKANKRLKSTVTVCYWLATTAFFLCYTCGPIQGKPEHSWFIWAIAGIMYAAVMAVINLIAPSRREK